MLKKVLKTVVYTLICSFMFIPVVLVFMLSWWLITTPDTWVTIGAGVIVAICGMAWITVPIKVSYCMIRGIWNPNFEFEFKIPIGS